MGSATRQALSSSRAELSALGGAVDLATAEQLFAAARAIGGSLQLRALLADASTEPAQKRAAIAAVFGGSFGATALELLSSAASNRWSSDDDLLAGIEELGIRAAAESVPAATSIEAELFAFGRAVSSDADLELAVGSKLGDTAAKVALVETLLAKKVSPQTLAIVRHLVQQPRGRRVGALVRYAASVVADQAGLSVATVTSARPIGPKQLERLQKGLSKTYGTEIRINSVIDPSVIGGIRVQVGDDVIDGSVATKLTELRLQLAG
ncbi:MAG: synthase subunit delta [Microbacteriaceae bacterium]|jgi:F-type H+-transporting ATPase subunit delta|nr:synthase subunit delta [Microbacteriaceae bacterium]HEV7956733.1 F0F1 ATP synthase subunit delta [Marisediminicola sp.]